jgi:hypothetical protein
LFKKAFLPRQNDVGKILLLDSIVSKVCQCLYLHSVLNWQNLPLQLIHPAFGRYRNLLSAEDCSRIVLERNSLSDCFGEAEFPINRPGKPKHCSVDCAPKHSLATKVKPSWPQWARMLINHHPLVGFYYV